MSRRPGTQLPEPAVLGVALGSTGVRRGAGGLTRAGSLARSLVEDATFQAQGALAGGTLSTGPQALQGRQIEPPDLAICGVIEPTTDAVLAGGLAERLDTRSHLTKGAALKERYSSIKAQRRTERRARAPAPPSSDDDRFQDLPFIPPPIGGCDDYDFPSTVTIGAVTATLLEPYSGRRTLRLDLGAIFPLSGRILAFYNTAVYEVTYEYAGVAHRTVMRLNAPTDLSDLDSPAGLVLFVAGARGTSVAVRGVVGAGGVTYVEVGPDDEPMAYLATGMGLRRPDDASSPFGREWDAPMFAVAYNNPGYGTGDLAASGDPAFEAHPTPNTGASLDEGYGDDFGGHMTVLAMDAVVRVAEEVIERIVAQCRVVGRRHRLIVTSFSYGLTAASYWIAWADEREVHALIDVEGPANSLETTLLSSCAPPWAGAASYADWYGCAEVEEIFHYFFRPPRDVLDEMREYFATHGTLRMPSVGMELYIYMDNYLDFYGDPHTGYADFDTSMIDELEEFWDYREAVSFLPHRAVPYIRVNGKQDHVQDAKVYKNAHAIRALLGASEAWGSFTRHVYFADTDYFDAAMSTNEVERDAAEPRPFDPDDFDLGDDSTFDPDLWPDLWPEFGSLTTRLPVLYRQACRVDLVRWALRQDFET